MLNIFADVRAVATFVKLFLKTLPVLETGKESQMVKSLLRWTLVNPLYQFPLDMREQCFDVSFHSFLLSSACA